MADTHGPDYLPGELARLERCGGKVRVCDCAACRRMVVTNHDILLDHEERRMLESEYGDWGWFGGRIEGRPYCERCFADRLLAGVARLIHRSRSWPTYQRGVVLIPRKQRPWRHDDAGPLQEVMIRQGEDAAE